MSTAFIILPNQLFRNNKLISSTDTIIIWEHPHYFHDYNYHKCKLVLHYSTMMYYYEYLKLHYNNKIIYFPHQYDYDHIFKYLTKRHINTINMYDPINLKIHKELKSLCTLYFIKLITHDSPMFIFTRFQLDTYYDSLKQHDRLYFTSFYIWSRKTLDLLMHNNKPLYGKWTFDKENRHKYPDTSLEYIYEPKINTNKYIVAAIKLVNKHFPNNVGSIDNYIYLTTFNEINTAFKSFLKHRLHNFGTYQDAISDSILVGYHSLLSPYINIGMIEPNDIINKTMKYYDIVQYSNLEGFIRQVIGWREYVRLLYYKKNDVLSHSNFFNNNKSLSDKYYTGSLDIVPVDNVIHKLIKFAYCHHIERLMILGNWMLINQIHSKQVFRWFMEFFIDSYEWVMAPNIYGMSQLSAGLIMMTRPYISSSNYILKMSNYSRDIWCDMWDDKYRKFLLKHKQFFKRSYATSHQVKSLQN